MKSIEYVKRYGQRIFECDMDAIIEMVDLLLREDNSEIACYRNRTRELANEKLEKYNRKGNTIAELFKREYGQDVLKPNWFKACVEMGTVEKRGLPRMDKVTK